jgi:hypothetical protein
MKITKEEYKRNCEYEKELEKLREKCEHPINKRIWYKLNERLYIACEKCGYIKVIDIERGD